MLALEEKSIDKSSGQSTHQQANSLGSFRMHTSNYICSLLARKAKGRERLVSRKKAAPNCSLPVLDRPLLREYVVLSRSHRSNLGRG